MKHQLTITTLCFAALLSNASASTLINGKYQWEFLSNEEWPIGYNKNTGKPSNMTWDYSSYPADFFSRINNALPEAKVNEAFLTSDAGANITLQEEGEIFVTFLHEGAGYKNAFGYFTFDKANPPTDVSEIQETIIFPNLSYPHMASGHRVNLGTFSAGTTIGFFLVANGFSYYTGVKDGRANHYYSLKDLNPDPTDELRQHNVLLFDEEVQEVIIGFEDLPRSWGDNDFNDAVFSVKSNPATAIETSTLVSMPNVDDSDADGVADDEDEFPNDYRRSSRSYYPSASDWVTLAFEDNWPRVGDYDMNDLVVRERFEKIYNADGEITGLRIDGYIDARGGTYHNGFAVRLMDIAPDALAETTLTIDNEVYEKSVEANQTDAVISLWSDSHVFTTTNEAGSCSHFNTLKSCTQFEPVPFTLDIAFVDTVPALTHAALDFFIYRTNYRGREIHFADYAPTDLFDDTQFGKLADTSNPQEGRYFRSATNLPWALKIPTQWRYPREYIDVLWAYPDYEEWVESSGTEATEWFNSSDRDTHYY